MSDQFKYIKEAADVRDRLKAKNVFLFVFEPDGQADRVVCGGTLDVSTAIKLVDALGELQAKVAADLKRIATEKKLSLDQPYSSN